METRSNSACSEHVSDLTISLTLSRLRSSCVGRYGIVVARLPVRDPEPNPRLSNSFMSRYRCSYLTQL